MKLLKTEIAADKKTIDRFRNELKYARKIAHKNVCRMYDINEEEGLPFITMEYVAGEDLKSFIRRSGQLTIGTVTWDQAFITFIIGLLFISSGWRKSYSLSRL